MKITVGVGQSEFRYNIVKICSQRNSVGSRGFRCKADRYNAGRQYYQNPPYLFHDWPVQGAVELLERRIKVTSVWQQWHHPEIFCCFCVIFLPNVNISKNQTENSQAANLDILKQYYLINFLQYTWKVSIYVIFFKSYM